MKEKLGEITKYATILFAFTSVLQYFFVAADLSKLYIYNGIMMGIILTAIVSCSMFYYLD